MNNLAVSIGSIAALIGLAIIVLSIVVLRENRLKSILMGTVFAILGASVIWLSFQGNSIFQINLGISDKQFGVLLVGFVMSLFILKGILDVREGSKNLQGKAVSSLLVSKSKFQIIVAIIMTTWVVLILLVAFTQFGK